MNIELKSEYDQQKILKQLIKNKYYLSFLKKEIFTFTFVSNIQKLYTIDEKNALIEADFENLVEKLENQEAEIINNLDSLFNPSDYLVSPFNSSKEFIEGKYFLTNRQIDIKKEVLEIISNKTNPFISIKGGAGTGKTLLIYDIVKELISERKQQVLVIHCGYLNSGHNILINDENWNIISVKGISESILSQYSVFVIDECQRIRPHQLKQIIGETKKNNKVAIFSYDLKQYLTNEELNNRIDEIIISNSASAFELKTKIRTNEEMAVFIKCLFNKKEEIKKYDYSDIFINFFNNKEDALEYIVFLRENNWKFINYTPEWHRFSFNNYSISEETDNSHKVIGQEFENIVVVIDHSFCYVKEELSTTNITLKNKKVEPRYNPVQMLYQNITRVRKRLNVIIVDNQDVLEQCLTILKKDR